MSITNMERETRDEGSTAGLVSPPAIVPWQVLLQGYILVPRRLVGAHYRGSLILFGQSLTHCADACCFCARRVLVTRSFCRHDTVTARPWSSFKRLQHSQKQTVLAVDSGNSCTAVMRCVALPQRAGSTGQIGRICYLYPLTAVLGNFYSLAGTAHASGQCSLR
jgi:hypothetical protein